MSDNPILWETKKSTPDHTSVLFCFNTFLSTLPVFISQWISNCIDFSSSTQQTSVVTFSFQISNWNQQKTSHKDHPLSHLFIGSSPTRSSLDEWNEIRNIVGHLRSRCWSTVFVFNQSVIKLSGHTDNHMIEIRIEMICKNYYDSLSGESFVFGERLFQ